MSEVKWTEFSCTTFSEQVLYFFKTNLVLIQNKTCTFSGNPIVQLYKCHFFNMIAFLVGGQLSLILSLFLSSCFVTFPSGCVSENIQNLYSLVSPSILDGLTCMTHHSIQNYVLNLMTFICSWLLFTYVTMNFNISLSQKK